MGPILGQLLGVGQEQLAPGGVLRGGLPGQIKVRLALHEPVQGTGLALDLGVDIQNHRLQGLVVPVPGHAVGQGLEAWVVCNVGVPPFQHLLQGLSAQLFPGALVAQAEVRVQPGQVAPLAQKVQTEGVNGADLGLID